MGDAFKGLVLVSRRDCRTVTQGISLGVPTEARDGIGRFPEEALPHILVDVAVRRAPVNAAEMPESTPDVHVAPTAFLG
eukprot:1289246-Lingulodinium_polyedra.AAC.1